MNLKDENVRSCVTPLFTRAHMGDGFELDARLATTLFNTLPGTDDANVRIRTKYFDDFVKGFIDKHPEANILNLGCGFCTRFWRVDNGQITWLDVDLPLIYAARLRKFPKNDRLKMATYDLRTQVVPGDFDLIIAEGLFNYLLEYEAIKLITGLTICDIALGKFGWYSLVEFEKFKIIKHFEIHSNYDINFLVLEPIGAPDGICI